MNIQKIIKKVKLFLPSREELLSRSHGEIKESFTYHYRTLLPIEDGLYCEKIFGPEKSYKCLCNKVYLKQLKNYRCKKCFILITDKNVRRYRFGHIKLNTYVVNPLFYKSPFILSKAIGLNSGIVQKIIHYMQYLAFKENNIDDYKILSEDEYDQQQNTLKENNYIVGTGAEILLKYANKINIKDVLNKLKNIISKNSSVKSNVYSQYKTLKLFFKNKTKLSNLFTDIILVLPANLRPVYIADNNNFIGTSDINLLYKDVIIRNKSLKHLIDVDAPEVLQNLNKQAIQLSVNKLIDNRKYNIVYDNILKTSLQKKSLIDYLTTKSGILRKNILGKRCDYSGRTVIIPDPTLKIGECSLPISIILDLLLPFVKRELIRLGLAKNIFETEDIIKNEINVIVNILQNLLKTRMALLNRAPTLHRVGIQAFYVKLNFDKVIGLHPLNCVAFNADFDGDQQGIHPNLVIEDIIESHFLMSTKVNIFAVLNGKCILKPNRVMLLGTYYATLDLNDKNIKNNIKIFNIKDVMWLFENDKIKLHDKVKILYKNKVINTTVGRVVFNDLLPHDIRNYLQTINNKILYDIINKFFINYSYTRLLKFLDNVKDFGCKISDKLGLTFSLFDLIIPKKKNDYVKSSLQHSLRLTQFYKNKKISYLEYERERIDLWTKTTKTLEKEMLEQNDKFSGHRLMLSSGARSKLIHIRQLCAIRGLMPTNKTVFPIVNSFKEGLSPFQTFISTFGSRNSSISKSLRTADTGYLNRRIVLAVNDIIISIEDCKTDKFLEYNLLKMENYEKETKIFGRTVFEDIYDKQKQLLLSKNDLLVGKNYNILINSNINKIKVRNILMCNLNFQNSVCAKCYGADLSSLKSSPVGEAVGILAAQTLSEPTMQLTLSSFHSGGILKFDNKKVKKNYSKNSGVIKIDKKWTKHIYNGIFKHYKNAIFYIDKQKYEVLPGSKILFTDKQVVYKKKLLYETDQTIRYYYSTVNGIIENIYNADFKIEYDSLHHIKNIYCYAKNRNDNITIFIRCSDNNIIEKIDILPGTSLLKNIGDKIKITDLIASKMIFKTKKHDIVDSFEKLEHLFENRKPKQQCIISPFNGIIIKENDKFFVKNKDKNKKFFIGLNCILTENTNVNKGDELTIGEIYVTDVLKLWGRQESMKFLIEKIYKIYQNNGINCNIKYIEILVSAMHNKVKIINSKGSILFEKGDICSLSIIKKWNHDKTKEEQIQYEELVVSLTKLSTLSDSIFASLISRETTRLLVEGACFGYDDNLKSIESSLLFSNIISVGTGYEFSEEDKKEFAKELILLNTKYKFEFNNITLLTWKKIYDWIIDHWFGNINKFLLSKLFINFYNKFNKIYLNSIEYKTEEEILKQSFKSIKNLDNIPEIINIL